MLHVENLNTNILKAYPEQLHQTCGLYTLKRLMIKKSIINQAISWLRTAGSWKIFLISIDHTQKHNFLNI